MLSLSTTNIILINKLPQPLQQPLKLLIIPHQRRLASLKPLPNKPPLLQLLTQQLRLLQQNRLPLLEVTLKPLRPLGTNMALIQQHAQVLCVAPRELARDSAADGLGFGCDRGNFFGGDGAVCELRLELFGFALGGDEVVVESVIGGDLAEEVFDGGVEDLFGGGRVGIVVVVGGGVAASLAAGPC